MGRNYYNNNYTTTKINIFSFSNISKIRNMIQLLNFFENKKLKILKPFVIFQKLKNTHVSLYFKNMVFYKCRNEI